MASSDQKRRRNLITGSKRPADRRSSLKPARPKPRKPTTQTLKTMSLLLELGTEELPASCIKPALVQLAEIMKETFVKERLGYQSVRTVGTPRRLAIIVEGLATRQSSLNREIVGPPQSVAYDAQGIPTNAAKGFASTQGVSLDALQIRETSKGVYLCAVKHESGRATSAILKEHLPQVIQQLTFPKSMKWNDSALRFARPLRWIVALYGNHPIRFTIGGISSGARSCGHRFLALPRSKAHHKITIAHPSAYEATLKRRGVMVDPQERRSLVQAQVTSLAKAAKGKIYPEHQEELLDEAVYSVEYPQAILGSFAPSYLMLPKEVLITAMKEHQGYFSLIRKNGALLPKFITVTNMKLPKMDVIRRGNERVLSARLSDAQYFFREDRKISLADRVEQLQGITFHQKLGSLHQKVIRLQELVPRIAESVNRSDVKAVCQRAAYLAKSDLTTGLVGEFPTLQGIMGREYAKHDRELPEVSDALGELYLPRTPEGPLPETIVGIFLGLGDRLDTLAAFFFVGLVPSGSEDPFALRRIGYGLVRIIVEHGLRLNLVHLISNAEQLVKTQGGFPHQDQDQDKEASLLEFLIERLRFFAKTVHHLRDDLIEAILGARPSEACDLADLFVRMQALYLVTTQLEFEPLIEGYKRVHRIVEKERWNSQQVSPELFEHEAEKGLYQCVSEAQPLLVSSVEQQNYQTALRALLQLKSPIDEFFESVMVNAPNPDVRANRLSLLVMIDRLFFRFADFSRIQASAN